MGRAALAVLLTAMVTLVCPGCRRQEKVRVQQTEDVNPTLATMVHVADPRVAPQLISGFYNIEQNAWRWSAKKFIVLLGRPHGTAQNGAVLKLQFSIPAQVVAKLKSITLSAAVNDGQLPPETYTQAGEFTYSRDVPAKLLSKVPVKVVFTLDKALAPGEVDQRELGLVVSTVGFEAK